MMTTTLIKRFFAISGWLIGLVSLIVAVTPKTPKLEFIIQNQTDLISQEKVQSLKIMYDTTDLQKSNLNVTIYKITLVNSGRRHISKHDYDDKIGFTIRGGSIIEPISVEECSSKYLCQAFIDFPIECSDSIALFPAVSFDKKECIVFRLSLLHDNNSAPVLECFGKIAGQKTILMRAASTIPSSVVDDNEDFMSKVIVTLMYFLLGMFSVLILELIMRKREKK